MPAREYFAGLPAKEAARMQALFNLLANQGRISSREKFKKLAERKGLAIWEFKRFQLRFLGGFAADRQFVVTHGLRKKQDKLRPQELERAARILKAHLARGATGGFDDG